MHCLEFSHHAGIDKAPPPHTAARPDPYCTTSTQPVSEFAQRRQPSLCVLVRVCACVRAFAFLRNESRVCMRANSRELCARVCVSSPVCACATVFGLRRKPDQKALGLSV
jgi:hypothetical protein